ncbi:hypothetical protein [Allorhizobium ampelinum]|uniref:hypothetical protein n=1 Tax=Allorhizobium ampelinum TaxID=3025782 RepID=UPI0011788B01|nr:hypothetical protein [Allorhizobium ampelinum]NTA27414.1 hypothetical protein [Allorhizobium ampelinum]
MRHDDHTFHQSFPLLHCSLPSLAPEQEDSADHVIDGAALRKTVSCEHGNERPDSINRHEEECDECQHIKDNCLPIAHCPHPNYTGRPVFSINYHENTQILENHLYPLGGMGNHQPLFRAKSFLLDIWPVAHPHTWEPSKERLKFALLLSAEHREDPADIHGQSFFARATISSQPE